MINSFSHFRAIAIIMIIAGHSYPLIGMQFNTLLDHFIDNIVTGGTSLFVFISGFFFHHVFYQKYNFKKFMIKKIQNILVPYLIIGFLPVVYMVWLKRPWFEGYFLPDGTGIINEYLVPLLKYYMTGKFALPYWYIPFIFVTFSLSPLHIKYIELNLKLQLLLLIGLSIVSVLIHRPVQNICVFQSVVYYTPVYLTGITVSMYRERIYKYLEGRDVYLLGIVIFLAFYQACLGAEGSYHKHPFEYGGIDLMYFQKIALCLFFVIWLHRFEEFNNKVLQTIAATSFTAFFIHPVIFFVLNRINTDFMKVNSWAALFLFVAVITLLCVLIAKLVKKYFPKHSRYIIGY